MSDSELSLRLCNHSSTLLCSLGGAGARLIAEALPGDVGLGPEVRQWVHHVTSPAAPGPRGRLSSHTELPLADKALACPSQGLRGWPQGPGPSVRQAAGEEGQGLHTSPQDP